jgi:RimJ/RimL family protein N-acetyltransferase
VIAPVPTVLAGRHVRLEPLAEHHRADLADASLDPSGFTVYGPRMHPEGFDGWFAQAQAELAAGTRLPFAVVLVATGQAVGSSSYLDIAPADGRIEIGHTWYGAGWQGGVVNPEAKLLLLGHAFDDLGATRVTLKTDARNERSRRAITGVGASFEGILRRHSRRADGPGLRDVAMFSVIDEDWPATRAMLQARFDAVRLPARGG